MPSEALADKISGEEHRREHPRCHLEVAVDFQSEHNFYTGLTRNISQGGLFVATNHLRRIGEHLRVRLTLPGGRTVEIETEVRWVKDASVSRFLEGGQGMGLRFVELAPEAAAAIQAFLDKRDSLFFDDE